MLICPKNSGGTCQILRTKPETEAAFTNHYIVRINRAIDHIVSNLAQRLNLQTIAALTGFSPFHFHRVFKSVTTETVSDFVKRQRLERALHIMSHAPKRSLTDIAMDCGFGSSSDFSRCFKQRYGTSPKKLDINAHRTSQRSAFDQFMSAQAAVPYYKTLPVSTQIPDGFIVTLRDLPARSVAYIRVFDPYRKDAVTKAYEKLHVWAVKQGLTENQWLGYMWDEPEIVALKDCRYDAAVVVDKANSVEFSGDIGHFGFPEMQVAEVRIYGDIELESRAFDCLYNEWLPRSGFIPDDHPVFEAWIGRPYLHGFNHFEIACQLPVKRV